MRTLRFIVDGKTITQDPSCDFSGLFPGRNPSVRAEFTFSSEWKNKVKVAAFWSVLDKEYEPQELQDDSCIIPSEALAKPSFKVQILGKRGKERIDTNKLSVLQRGDKR